MKRLYWIRHAEPDYPGGKRMCMGRKIDLPLSAEGYKQARELGIALRKEPIEYVYSSPTERALQTAQALTAERGEIRVMESLRELNGGIWTGKTFEEIYREYPEYFAPEGIHSPPPGGESDEEGLRRVMEALSLIEGQTEHCAAVVAHSSLNRILLSALLHRPLEEKKRIPQEYACINVLEHERGEWNVREVSMSARSWEERKI